MIGSKTDLDTLILTETAKNAINVKLKSLNDGL